MGCSRQRMNFLLAIALVWAGSSACNQDETKRDSKSVEESSEVAQAPSASFDPAAKSVAADPAGEATVQVPTPPPAPVADPAATQAARAMATAWGNIQSMSQEVEMTFLRMKGDEEMVSRNGMGTVDYRLTDGKWFMRSQTRHSIKINVKEAKREDGAEWISTGQILIRVAQGRTIYTLAEGANDLFEATKRWTNPADLQFLGGKPLVARLRRLGDVHLGPENSLDGKNVVVFESKSSDGNLTNRFFVETATGVLLKAEGTNKNLETFFTYTVMSTKFDVTFPDDHFEIALPEKVKEFRDLTQAPTTPQEPSPEPSKGETDQ